MLAGRARTHRAVACGPRLIIRSLRMLDQATPERGEVRDLLLNVAGFPANSGHGGILDFPVTTTGETCP